MDKAEKPKVTSRAYLEALASGFLWAFFLVILPYFLLKQFGTQNNFAHVLAYSYTLIVFLPLIQGLYIAYKLANYEVGVGKWFLLAILVYIIDSFAASLFYGEGYICLIMAAPIYLCLIQLGIWIGRGIKKARNRKTIQASIIPVAVLLVALDTTAPSPDFSNAISDTITVKATPEQVWKYMVEYPVNSKPSDYWLWDIGLPMPTQSVAEAKEVGAKRECRFTDGIVFEEKITELVPAKVLTFDITKQPAHPEIIGHFSLDKGQMYLERNPDGTTTIIATSWYRIHARPAKYFDWWAADIVRNVHFRVLGHIKELAENDARQNG